MARPPHAATAQENIPEVYRHAQQRGPRLAAGARYQLEIVTAFRRAGFRPSRQFEDVARDGPCRQPDGSNLTNTNNKASPRFNSKGKVFAKFPSGALIPGDGCAGTFWHNVRCGDSRPRPIRPVMKWWTLQQLKSKKPETRKVAVERLFAENPAEAVDHLLALANDPDHEVRKAVVQALGRTKDEKVLTP